MEITLLHSIVYSTKGDVPVSVVAKSLLANERFMQESIRLLEAFDKDLKATSVKIKVAKLSNESPLREVLAGVIFLAYQKELEKEVPALIQALTGHAIPADYATLITALVFLIAVYVVDATVERLIPGKAISALKAEYEDKKQYVAKLLKIDPLIIEDAVNSRFGNGRGKALAQKASDFFLPAKIEAGTEISSDNNLKISKEAISEVPSVLDIAKLEQSVSYDLDAAEIEIHRSDLDEQKHGWRAIIKDVVDRKVRMELHTDISPKDLYGKTKLRGNVTVIEEVQPDGGYAVRAYHLTKVISTQ